MITQLRHRISVTPLAVHVSEKSPSAVEERLVQVMLEAVEPSRASPQVRFGQALGSKDGVRCESKTIR